METEENFRDTLKFIFIAALFVVTFVSSLLPLRIISNLRNVIDPEKRAKYSRLVSVLNCYSGGVFLGTALLDLLPQISSVLKKAIPNSTFPFAEFIIAFGFIVLLATEQIVIDCKERTSDGRNPIERLQTRNIQLERETLTTTNQDEEQSRSSIVPNSQTTGSANENSESVFHSLFLMVALSIHSIFEGLTIGMFQSNEMVLWLFIAILIHKIPVAFSLGLSLVQCELKISAVIQLDLWFSLMSPVGAGIGIILGQISTMIEFNLLNGILLGITTGSFIFVVFLEILPKELKKGRGRLLNLLFLILGFSTVCVAILFEHDKWSTLTSR